MSIIYILNLIYHIFCRSAIMISSTWILKQMRPAIRAFHQGKWPDSPKRDTPPRDAETLYREWKRQNGQH